MASLTPVVPRAGTGPADGDFEPLRVIHPTAAADPGAVRHPLRSLAAALRSSRGRAVADLAAAAAVLLVAVGAAGADVVDPVVALVLGLAWCAALAGAGAWSARTAGTNARAVLRAGVALGLGCWVADAVLDPAASSAQLLGLVLALAATAALLRVVTAALPGSHETVRVAIVGDCADVRRLLGELDREASDRWQVAAVCIDAEEPGNVSVTGLRQVPIWIGVEEVVRAALTTGAGAVLIAPGRTLCPATVRRLSWLAQEAGLEVFVGTGLLDVTPARATLVSAGDIGLMHLRPTSSPSASRVVKEVAERVLAAAAIVFLLPVLVATTLAVRIDSRGGALFRQTRVGRNERTFTMYKFRTMTTDAEHRLGDLADDNDCDGVLFKMRTDPRITRVGAILRRYSLDELPQLLNVLLGHMSLVGPRPALPQEVARYDVDPLHRLVVKPGLTGLWQVSGRSDLSWEESVRLDLHYVDNWSLALDAQIALRTVGAVLGHRGAY